MKQGPHRPDWDTPADGDFASYVERLTAAPDTRAKTVSHRAVAVEASPPAPAPAAPMGVAPAVIKRAMGKGFADAVVLAPPELAQVLAPLVGLIRPARAVLLLLAVANGVALFFGQGSLWWLMMTAAMWWGLGTMAARLAPVLHPLAAGGSAAARTSKTGAARPSDKR